MCGAIEMIAAPAATKLPTFNALLTDSDFAALVAPVAIPFDAFEKNFPIEAIFCVAA
ncbi:hypothetical protein WSS15_20150 [Acetobacter pasteurianus]|nr:hypothetical protein WSS15_20150 [Acetobacter pasteurianus]